MAGRIIEVVTGEPLETFLHRRITEPCNMVDTGFWVPADQGHRLAGMCGSFDAVAKGVIIPLPRADLPVPGGAALMMTDGYIDDGKPRVWPNSTAGAVSTVDDYFNFVQMLLGGLRSLSAALRHSRLIQMACSMASVCSAQPRCIS